MGLKLFGPGGIDQKSNDLTRSPDKLRDALNIRYNIKKEFEKRLGTDRDSSFSDDVYSDVIFIKSLNEYFFRYDGNYYVYTIDEVTGEISEKKQLTVGAVDPTSEDTSLISGAEYLNTFIFTHQDGQRGTFKYDGNSVYLAGLPVPTVTSVQSGSAASGFMINFYDFTDAKGNKIFGPSKITTITSDTQTLSITTPKLDGFYDGYLILNTYTGWTYLGDKYLRPDTTVADRTITYTSKSDDIVVGSKIPIRNVYYHKIQNTDATFSNTGNDLLLLLEIESIDGNEIVFTSESFRGYSLNLADGKNISCALCMRSYYSSSETTGYSERSNQYLIQIDLSITSQSGTGELIRAFNTSGDRLLSDIYDITTSKIRPPKCKFIKAYGWQLAYGNVLSFWDFTNKETNYTNNDLVMYSDVNTGDIGENVSEINRQLIGDTYDGQITGMVRARDSLIVTKTNSIYALDGILVEGQYAVRKIETNEVGCLSDKSMMVIDGGVVFQGIDGLYAISGNYAKKISGLLDPFFAQDGFDPSLTRSVMDVLNESYLFFTNKGTIVFNFEFKEWFIWKYPSNLIANNGLTVNNDYQIRMFNDTTCYKFIDKSVGISDFNPDYPMVLENIEEEGIEAPDRYLPIDAWVKSAWFDMGEPSLLKKVIDIRYFSLGNLGQTLYSRLFYNWADKGNLFFDAVQDDNTSKVKPVATSDAFEIDMSSPSTKTVLKKLDIQQAQSFSLLIGNNTLDEDLNLSGYEINAGIIQEKDKNV